MLLMLFFPRGFRRRHRGLFRRVGGVWVVGSATYEVRIGRRKWKVFFEEIDGAMLLFCGLRFEFREELEVFVGSGWGGSML